MTATDHSERAHNIFGGSSAERNYKCQGNVALKILKKIPASESSDAAREGTKFHELIDVCGKPLAMYYNKKRKLPKLDLLLDFPTKDNWSEEMQRHARTWFEKLYAVIKDKNPKKLFPELVVEYPEPVMDGEEEYYLGGPADFMFGYQDKHDKFHLFIADAKYGVGYVDESSLQLLFYGCCAAAQFSKRTYETLTVAVFQPRAEAGDAEYCWRSYTYDKERLSNWTGNFRVSAIKSVSLIGEDEDVIEQHLEAGKWCGFCDCKHVCPAWNAEANENAVLDFKDIEELVVRDGNTNPASVAQTLIPMLDTPEKIARFLHFSPYLKKIISHVQDFAIVSMLEGQDIPGWKVVDGRSQRRFKKDETVIVVEGLKQLGIKDPYTQKLRGIGSIETELKKLGMSKKEAGEAIAPLVEKSTPGKNLVADSDIRQAVQLEDDAVKDFEGIELDFD